ncbi:MAG: Hpt domain-containing protein [Taibaiella sp.]|nr:Hpt domain-containing protein [Taibaiella sp.]
MSTHNRKYTHIDLEYIYEMADGENDFAASILNECLLKMPQILDDLTIAISEGNYEDINYAAHKLKSTFGYLGVGELTMLMIEIEQACRIKHGLPWIAASLEKITTVYELAKTELDEELKILQQ